MLQGWAFTLVLFPILLNGGLQSAELPRESASISSVSQGNGNNLTLLFDYMPDPSAQVLATDVGSLPWGCIGQDKESYKTGKLDVLAIIKEVERRFGQSPPKWMQLDCESPFFKNLLCPRDSEEFRGAMQTMLETLRAMKARFPQCQWSFYGIPQVPYWVNKKGWGSLTDAERMAELTEVAERYAPLVDEMDWVSVSIYQMYDPKMVVPGSRTSLRGTPESVRHDGRVWRAAAVGLAKLMARGKPVLPTVFPYWSPSGIAPYCRVIPVEEFIADQIMPAVNAGADGFALWTNADYRIRLVSSPDPEAMAPKPERNFSFREWRAAFTADYFNGQEPADWSSIETVRQLKSKVSQTLLSALRAIRAIQILSPRPPASGVDVRR
jgi:hypothetical protein